MDTEGRLEGGSDSAFGGDSGSVLQSRDIPRDSVVSTSINRVVLFCNHDKLYICYK